jgi:hypothetical protein
MWRCKSDYRGNVYDVNVTAARNGYGNGYAPNNYAPGGSGAYDYSQYGYQRY